MAEAHIRIDEGLKRGPRKKKSEKQENALNALRQPFTVALRPMSHLTPEERHSLANAALDRYVNGEQVATIAPDFDISDVTLYALLLREHQEAWKDIQSARALARLERSQEEVRVATDALSLGRARELVRSAQWELERILHRLYGQKQEVNVNIDLSVRVDNELASSARKLMERARGVAQTTNGAVLQPIIDIDVPD